jgi:MerR family mercuric resistance operon transcriptional regulator
MKSLTIGKLAETSGLSSDTIRFYEKRKLIQPVSRNESGYRLYDSTVRERLEFIIRAKEVGFTLDEIHQLLLLRDDPTGSCAEVKEHGRQKMLEIDRKIQELSRMKETLTPLLMECSGEGPRSECPILGALDKEDRGQ